MGNSLLNRYILLSLVPINIIKRFVILLIYTNAPNNSNWRYGQTSNVKILLTLPDNRANQKLFLDLFS